MARRLFELQAEALSLRPCLFLRARHLEPALLLHSPFRAHVPRGCVASFRMFRHRRCLNAAVLLNRRAPSDAQAPLCGSSREPRSCWAHHAGRDSPMKIGLIAMSGVRAHDEALREVGLTFPALWSVTKLSRRFPASGC